MGKPTDKPIRYVDQIVVYDAYYLMVKRVKVEAPFAVAADEIVEYVCRSSQRGSGVSPQTEDLGHLSQKS
jgi:hypothetical protein